MPANTINLGNQDIIFDFKTPGKGSEFSKMLYTLVKPGVTKGLNLEINSDTSININPGFAFVNFDFKNETLRSCLVRFKDKIYNYSIPQTAQNISEIIYIKHTYYELANNWVSFNHQPATGSAPINSVVLGRIDYNILGNITGIDYSDKSYALLDENYSINDSNTFANSLDPTKKIKLDLSGLTGYSEYNIGIPDHDSDIGSINDWVTGRNYKINEVVVQGTSLYLCIVDHTSGTFLTDLNSNKWMALTDSTGVSQGSIKNLSITSDNLSLSGGSNSVLNDVVLGMSNNPTFNNLHITGTLVADSISVQGSTFANITVTGISTLNQVNAQNISVTGTINSTSSVNVYNNSTTLIASTGTINSERIKEIILNNVLTINTNNRIDNVDLQNYSYIRFAAATGISGFNSIDFTTQGYNKLIIIENVSATDLTLLNQSSNSLIQNRIYTGTGTDLVLSAKKNIILIYDTIDSLWKIIGGTGNSNTTSSSYDLINTLVKTGNYTALAGERVLFDNSSGTFTISAPSSPSDSDLFGILDVTGAINTNDITLNGNGKLINGQSSLVIDSHIVSSMVFIYSSSKNQWYIDFVSTTQQTRITKILGEVFSLLEYKVPSDSFPALALSTPSAIINKTNYSYLSELIDYLNGLKTSTNFNSTQITGTVSATNSATITISGGSFSAGDIGKTIWINGQIRTILTQATSTAVLNDVITCSGAKIYSLNLSNKNYVFDVKSYTDSGINVILNLDLTIPETYTLFYSLYEDFLLSRMQGYSWNRVLRINSNYGNLVAGNSYNIKNVSLSTDGQITIEESAIGSNYAFVGINAIEIYPFRYISTGVANDPTSIYWTRLGDGDIHNVGVELMSGLNVRDRFQGHIQYYNTNTTIGAAYTNTTAWTNGQGSYIEPLKTDGINGTPRVGQTTRTAGMGVYYYIWGSSATSGSTGGAGGLLNSSQTYTSNFTATSGIRSLCDTSAGQFTATLPTGSDGMLLGFSDVTGYFGNNPLILNPGTDKIMGVVDTYSLNISNMTVEMFYVANRGWYFNEVPQKVGNKQITEIYKGSTGVNGTATKITGYTIKNDANGYFNDGTSSFVAIESGWYELNMYFQVQGTSGANQSIAADIYKNGTQLYNGTNYPCIPSVLATSQSYGYRQTWVQKLLLSQGDAISIWGSCTGGGANINDIQIWFSKI